MGRLVLMGAHPRVPASLEAGLPQPACLSPPAFFCFFFVVVFLNLLSLYENADSPSPTQAFGIQQLTTVM